MTAFTDMNADLVASELGRDCIRLDVVDTPTFRGILENKYLTENDGNFVVEDEYTVLGCVETDVSGMAKGENLSIDSKNYEVVAIRRDHEGWLELVIEATE